ncbi:Major Facilitator Superfamily [Rhizoctonia solani]|uniref:Major Facilitator Superfamily n=1 Tax=Rhizoctonia solani TaxID=456999 RepID=A0A8H7H3T1_9AGAM|nr:Major Facilitator Superfamily [Rhizoctonia solani]
MNSVHSLLQPPKQELVGGPHEVRGVILTHKLPERLRKGSIWILWVILGAVIFINILSQWAASTTLLLELQYSFRITRRNSEQISRGMILSNVFATLAFGRLADVRSRHAASGLALLFFVVGCIMCAASTNSTTFAAGAVFHSMQRWTKITVDTIYCGLYITQVARRSSILDLSSLSGYDMAATENLYYHVMEVDIRNVCAFSLPEFTSNLPSLLRLMKFKNLVSRMDPIGLSIFTLGFALIEYNSDPAFTSIIADKYPPGRIAKLTIGLLFAFPIFIVWELYGTSFPLMPRRVLQRKGMLFAIMINFLFWLASIFPVAAVKDFMPFVLWNSNDLGLLLSTSAIAYNASAPLLGLVYYFTQRYKPFLCLGCVLFALGCALWVHVARDWDFTVADELPASAAYLFTIQALIGFGIIAVDMGTLISAQASVAHDDLATVTALLAVSSQLATSVGNVVGTASSVLDGATRSVVWLSLALGLSILCLFLSLFVPNYILGNEHSAAEVERREEQDSLESQSK